MTVTDIFTICCAFVLVCKGFTRGFLASLIGPLALILGSIASFIYYKMTQNMIVSLCIGLLAPLILNWIFRSFFNTDSVKNLNLLSRLSGAFISLLWGMSMLAIAVLLLALIPSLNEPLRQISKDIHGSKIYNLVKAFDLSATPSQTSTASSEDNIKTLSQDKKMQEIMNDPQLVAAINRKDYAAVISNPKFNALMQDPALIKKILAVYKGISTEKSASPSN